jgi:hypothetical protein
MPAASCETYPIVKVGDYICSRRLALFYQKSSQFIAFHGSKSVILFLEVAGNFRILNNNIFPQMAACDFALVGGVIIKYRSLCPVFQALRGWRQVRGGTARFRPQTRSGSFPAFSLYLKNPSIPFQGEPFMAVSTF